jgi:hypothetical protein
MSLPLLVLPPPPATMPAQAAATICLAKVATPNGGKGKNGYPFPQGIARARVLALADLCVVSLRFNGTVR